MKKPTKQLLLLTIASAFASALTIALLVQIPLSKINAPYLGMTDAVETLIYLSIAGIVMFVFLFQLNTFVSRIFADTYDTVE